MKGKHIMAKKGLGKGIDVLIPQAKEKTKSEKENICGSGRSSSSRGTCRRSA